MVSTKPVADKTLVTVARYTNPTLAHIARAKLEAAGIPCTVWSEAMADACCGGTGEILIKVPASDRERAERALRGS